MRCLLEAAKPLMDYIFQKQLENRALDQELAELERLIRAAAETEQRRRDREARNKRAERLRGEQSVEELKKQMKETKEWIKWCEEAIAIRADERRRRAHEERLLQEEKQRRERELRICQKLARMAREEECARRLNKERRKRKEEERRREQEQEANRQRQEARERFIREQQERLAREAEQLEACRRTEKARRAAEEEQIRQHFVLYEVKWNELRTDNTLPPIDVQEMPWPVLGGVSSADQITYQAVRTFLFHPQQTGVQGKTGRDKVKAEVLRFHPDKFNTRIVPKIIPSQQAVAQEIPGAIARILTTILTEEVE